MIAAALVAAVVVTLVPPPATAGDVFRPGIEESFARALGDVGLLCAAASDCNPDVEIGGDSVRVLGNGRYVLRHAVAPGGDCLSAPSLLVVCPDGPSDADRGAAAAAAGRLSADPDGAATLASLWNAEAATYTPWVRPVSRVLDAVLAAWLVLLVVVLALARRGVSQRDAFLTACLVAGGAVLRLLVPAGPTISYFPAVPQGPFPDVYAVSYPPVIFDSLYRWLAAVRGADERWLFGIHTALGALAPGLAFLAARRLGGSRLHAAIFALFLAAHPIHVWIARSESYHLWPLVALPAALLGYSLEGRRLVRATGLLLAGLSLVLGAAARLETAPGLFLSGALVLAIDPAQARRRLVPIAATCAVASLAVLAVIWDILPVMAEHSGAARSDATVELVWDSALRAVVFHDTLTPTWAWAAGLLPGLAVGAAVWLRERRWLALLVVTGGALGAVLPVLATRAELQHTTNWRYAALALPFVAWWAAAGWERVFAFLVRRSRWLLALAVVPPVLLFAAAWPDLTGRLCWQAEYAFLADSLGELPETCTVTAVQSADNWTGIGATFLTLPYAPLQLRYRTLRWQLVHLGEEPPALAERPGCQAIYVGAICDQLEQGLGEDAGPDPILGVLMAGAEPTCRALIAQASGDPLAETVTPLRPPESPTGILPDRRVRLRLLRVR